MGFQDQNSGDRSGAHGPLKIFIFTVSGGRGLNWVAMMETFTLLPVVVEGDLRWKKGQLHKEMVLSRSFY